MLLQKIFIVMATLSIVSAGKLLLKFRTKKIIPIKKTRWCSLFDFFQLGRHRILVVFVTTTWENAFSFLTSDNVEIGVQLTVDVIPLTIQQKVILLLVVAWIHWTEWKLVRNTQHHATQTIQIKKCILTLKSYKIYE